MVNLHCNNIRYMHIINDTENYFKNIHHHPVLMFIVGIDCMLQSCTENSWLDHVLFGSVAVCKDK